MNVKCIITGPPAAPRQLASRRLSSIQLWADSRDPRGLMVSPTDQQNKSTLGGNSANASANHIYKDSNWGRDHSAALHLSPACHWSGMTHAVFPHHCQVRSSGKVRSASLRHFIHLDSTVFNTTPRTTVELCHP